MFFFLNGHFRIFKLYFKTRYLIILVVFFCNYWRISNLFSNVGLTLAQYDFKKELSILYKFERPEALLGIFIYIVNFVIPQSVESRFSFYGVNLETKLGLESGGTNLWQTGLITMIILWRKIDWNAWVIQSCTSLLFLWRFWKICSFHVSLFFLNWCEVVIILYANNLSNSTKQLRDSSSSIQPRSRHT